MAGKGQAVGIDFGTTYSCVGVFLNGKVKIITNDHGNSTTPSYVAFTETERQVGDAAKNQVALNATNTIFDAKRLIGRNLRDSTVQADIKHWPFKVINKGGKPNIQAEHKGETKIFTPEEICSMVLIKMKESAEAYLGKKVTEAVITVPAYFNDSQRQATKDAGFIAGLNVLRIMNEPSAAALAYGSETNFRGTKNVLIFDLGGGTFSVSVVSIIEGSLFEVLSTAGDTHLGGGDFDNIMVDHFVNEFERKYKKDISSNGKALIRLRTVCERAKRTLSSSTQASVEIDSLFEGINFYTNITRARFEELCSDLFRTTLEIAAKALGETKLDKSRIHEIVMVGGSTRIPKIQKMLSEFMNGKELNTSVDRDVAVAYGAAIQAAILVGNRSDTIKDVLLIDVAPSFSIGTETSGGEVVKLFEKNTRIPANASQILTTYVDNQSEISIKVFEGKRGINQDNHHLGNYYFTGLPIVPRGVPEIGIHFRIDPNGLLDISAYVRSPENAKQIHITNSRGMLCKEDIDRMVSKAEEYKKEDEIQTQRSSAIRALESFAYNIKETVNIHGDKLSTQEKDYIFNACDVSIQWLDSNYLVEKEKYEEKMKELKRVCTPIMTKLLRVQTW